MARRHLSSDEQAIWNTLTQSVRPLRPRPRPEALTERPVAISTGRSVTPLSPRPVDAPSARAPATMLDTSWERRIRSGTLTPDMTVDLHGHSLSSAHARLNQALSSALARDHRVLLIITGKPPKLSASSQQSRRGAIRGEIGHWLETSAYADRIASVRQAHPRHGGTGAIYIILRRKK
ncbi:Smr/MutS family protein [Sphingomonadales bacterium 56]|uniref:Smr/MutS family protein n=1 Tax=unclassified Sphingobium TaxID=2611147 RepID=UPI00191A0332|nr:MULTISPECIES: Smr/MutS family protein [unclassified Sphingobium]MBY2928739.1 Smr/MutS family protein [Sphingomonadales bacterium 56]MBY2959412.1 Smr/MutS family protein [Sphingomonadales bacterium 58]CAD7337925.1 hypothetical protein SPHS6_01744 [Sphingobium sp. S6]CAD7338894.1 hypothetical protein SPHS8_02368 [Sphingobium sp. S8]